MYWWTLFWFLWVATHHCWKPLGNDHWWSKISVCHPRGITPANRYWVKYLCDPGVRTSSQQYFHLATCRNNAEAVLVQEPYPREMIGYWHHEIKWLLYIPAEVTRQDYLPQFPGVVFWFVGKAYTSHFKWFRYPVTDNNYALFGIWKQGHGQVWTYKKDLAGSLELVVLYPCCKPGLRVKYIRIWFC